MNPKRQRFDSEAASVPLEVERRTPIRAPSVEADVTVPLLQSVATSLLVGGVSGLAAWRMGAPDPKLVALGVGAAVLILAWLLLLAQGRELLWQVDRATPLERERPEPAPRETVRVELARADRRTLTYAHLPGDPDRLGTLARGVLAGQPLSEAAWTGAGRPFSRSEFQDLRSELLRAGLVRWRNPDAPAQGLEPTPAGRAVFRRLAQGQAGLPAPPALPGA